MTPAPEPEPVAARGEGEFTPAEMLYLDRFADLLEANEVDRRVLEGLGAAQDPNLVVSRLSENVLRRRAVFDLWEAGWMAAHGYNRGAVLDLMRRALTSGRKERSP